MTGRSGLADRGRADDSKARVGQMRAVGGIEKELAVTLLLVLADGKVTETREFAGRAEYRHATNILDKAIILETATGGSQKGSGYALQLGESRKTTRGRVLKYRSDRELDGVTGVIELSRGIDYAPAIGEGVDALLLDYAGGQ